MLWSLKHVWMSRIIEKSSIVMIYEIDKSEFRGFAYLKRPLMATRIKLTSKIQTFVVHFGHRLLVTSKWQHQNYFKYYRKDWAAQPRNNITREYRLRPPSFLYHGRPDLLIKGEGGGVTLQVPHPTPLQGMGWTTLIFWTPDPLSQVSVWIKSESSLNLSLSPSWVSVWV